MAHTFHKRWQQDTNEFAPGSLCEIARTGSPRRSTLEQGSGATPSSDQGEVVRRRIWRAMTWIVFANVLAFWLLTCITAFAMP